ncbi:hypothetical protein [Hymenobacter sp. CRA2]|uniref:hypothetical protein n=1 Tax=Hymenobacter sp. CRA2 TaxID=1955620 RepID=UPI00098FDEDE|nr:hypothetical protein [Hymenobacter sp. CRA2]OON67809.1 hypothetical protein B0919_16625 [Hymenobacter sp. CRA2]
MSSIKEALEQLTGNMLPVAVLAGTVTAVRPADRECDVQPDNDDAELLDVALLSGVYPAVGSPVLVGLIENRRTDAFLLSAERVTHLRVATERENLLTWTRDFLDELLRLTVSTPLGPSGPPLNAAPLTVLKNRLDNLLRA